MKKLPACLAIAGLLTSSMGLSTWAVSSAQAGSNYSVVKNWKEGRNTVYKLKCTNGATKYITYFVSSGKWVSGTLNRYSSMDKAATNVCYYR